VTISKPAYPSSDQATSVAQVERAQLCDLFDEAGPHAPTLCGSWDTQHLAAHLVAREATPLGLLATLRPKVAQEEIDKLVADRDFASLVGEIRGGPPRLSVFGTGLTDRLGNALEFFIHHEDVRRAAPGYEHRELPGWAADQLWQGLTVAARGLMRKAPVGAALRRSDTGQLAVGSKKARTVIVAGPVSELALFAFGRGSVADVSFDGAPEDVAALRSARFGL